MPMSLEPDVRKVLCPGVGSRHTSVALAVLRPGFVLETSIGLQGVAGCGNLRRCRLAGAAFLAWLGNDDACQVTDAPGLGFAPAKRNGQPFDAVVRVVLMDGLQLFDGYAVTAAEPAWPHVDAGPAHTQHAGEVFQPSRFDLFQDGYFFDFCISAVARPSSLYNCSFSLRSLLSSSTKLRSLSTTPSRSQV